MPTKVVVAVGVGLGVGIPLVIKCLGEVVGTCTVVGVWLLLGLITFFTLPLQFFPPKSDAASISSEPSPSEEKKRKTVPWLVRLGLTILLVPLILGSLSIRRSGAKKEEPNSEGSVAP